MSSKERKKQREWECLQATINGCPKNRGETRRILEMLQLRFCDSSSERPDFIFNVPPSNNGGKASLIGVEHFRVDQCCERQRKRPGVNSLTMKRNTDFNRIRNKYADELGVDGVLSDDAIAEMTKLVADMMTDRMSTSYNELIASFRTTFLQHLSNAPVYRRNLNAKATNGERVQIGFLIELHSDMSRYAFAYSKDSRQCEPGDILIFDDMLDVISKSRGKIDFVIIAACGNSDTNPCNVIAFKCGNPEKSITKQHVPICTYAGIDAGLEPFTAPKTKVSIHGRERRGEEIDLTIAVDGSKPDEDTRMELVMRTAMRAWFARREGRAFVANRLMVEAMNVFYEVIAGWRKLSDDDGEWRVRPIL